MKTKLHNSLFLSLSLFLTINLLSFSQTYIVNDDFENDALGSAPDGWILKHNGTGIPNQKVVDNPVYNGVQSFQMEGAGGWASTYYKVASSMPDQVTLEAWIMPEKILSGLVGTIGLGNVNVGTWGTYTSRLCFTNGVLLATYYSGGPDHIIQSYEANTWYHIKMEHDLTAKTYKVYINGVLSSGDDGNGPTTVFPMHPTVASSHIVLVAGNSGTTKMFWDDIKLFETGTLAIDEKSTGYQNFYISDKTLYITGNTDLNNLKEIIIFNVLGQNVLKISQVSNQINLENFEQGIYIVKVKNKDSHITTKKIVIQ